MEITSMLWKKLKKKILISWKSRNLTPIGNITVVKTLVIPKLNHLIITITNPSV